MSIGIMYPQMPATIGGVVPYAEAARRGGHRLWFGHSTNADSHLTMAALIGRGYSIPFGSAVSLFPLWHPHGLAVQARSIARFSTSSYVIALGPGGDVFQTKTLGARIERPVSATLAYAESMREVLGSGPVDATAPSREVEIGFGVLRPAMARAAGRGADWAVTWLAPADYLRSTIVPECAGAARAAGRRAPRIASVVHVAIRRPGRDAVALADAANHDHLSAPHYVAMLQQAGLPIEPGDPLGSARALVDDGTYLYGSAQEVADQIGVLEDAGVDQVVVNVFGVLKLLGDAEAYEDLEELLDELQHREMARILAGTDDHLPHRSALVPAAPAVPAMPAAAVGDFDGAVVTAALAGAER
jgi:hypothetical protein